MALRPLLRRMTILDRVIVLTLFAAALCSFFLLGARQAGQKVVVERNGRVVFAAPLDIERRVALAGPLGETVLVLHDGKVCVETSPCPLKVCMGMGEVSRQGEMLACVPNELIVRIEGGRSEEGDYDLLSR